VSECVIQTLTVIFGQVVTERNVSLFSGELNNGHYASVLPGEEEESLGVFD
jgi:hypothetical protein